MPGRNIGSKNGGSILTISRSGQSRYWAQCRAGEAAHAAAQPRGSAAGSLVAYVLNITNIDPIRYNLLFERKQMRSLNLVNSGNPKAFAMGILSEAC